MNVQNLSGNHSSNFERGNLLTLLSMKAIIKKNKNKGGFVFASKISIEKRCCLLEL